ncbi:DUF6562 domain-containing protein [Bacteroides fluxus]|uniref:DUF6562 domain-containing protein n=1 Tax=Bacteroides fluxus TaxID=626930 RepID=UPI0023A901C9|nr:DUF6562 domain-containing protein [Bacteroides fluxus]
MKKNFLYSVMALFVILLASCSQEEIISENSENGKITVSVGVPGSATTRAGMPEVESMTRRCIMQVVDENGTAIEGEEMRQTTEVTGDKVNFSFTEPEGEYSVVFWADYVTSIAKDNCYNTAALPNVTLAHNKNTMFTAAGDAFCGKMAKGGSTSIVLKRPFNKIVVGSTNKEAFGECKEIQIAEFSVPDGYNIMSKTCSAAKNIKRERIAMNDATTGEWTSFFVFAPSNQTDTKLELPIMLYKEGDATDAPAIKFTASTSAPTDENMIGSMDIPNIPADKVDVEISFDDKFTNDGSTEPEEPVVPGEMKVGSYINAAGEVVTDAANAVGIVFALEALNGDVAANYPETLKSKTIKGYAVAISNAAPTRQQIIADNETLTFTMPEKPTNGTQTTEALLNGIGSEKAFVTTYNTWVNEHALTGANLSAWYIPTFDQLKYFANMLFTIGDITATGSAEFKALPEFAFENGKIFDRTPIVAVNYASSSINANSNISVMQFDPNGTAKGTQAVVTGDATKATAIICRPFLTIFGE